MTEVHTLNCNTDEVEKKLFDVLIEMMLTKDLDQCATSEILEKAGIGKSTFYRHYKDKYDLLNSSYCNLLASTFFCINEGASYKTAFLTLYHILQDHAGFFYHAFRSQGQNSLQECVYNAMMEGLGALLSAYGFRLKDVYQHYLMEAYITGTLQITYTWILSGAKESPETMLKLVYAMMPEEIRTIISLNYM